MLKVQAINHPRGVLGAVHDAAFRGRGCEHAIDIPGTAA
jgi:hypothetical protein